MASTASTQQICTRLLLRAQSSATAGALCKRHYSTFSFFSRNNDPVVPQTNSLTEQPQPHTRLVPSDPKALRTSPSYDQAAPLLSAIQNKDQDTAWMIYSVLSRAGQLSSLLPIHHSLLLKSIRPVDPKRFTTLEVQKLAKRFEQVWAGMLSCNIQPDMNNYTTRLEFFVATRQYAVVDQTWREMSAELAGGRTSGGPPLLPTLFTYNLILKSCVPRKNIDLASDVIQSMKRAGVQPDTTSWDYVLQVHTAMKNWPAIEAAFRSAFITTQDSDSGGQPGTLGLQKAYRQQGSTSELMAIPLGQKPRTLHGGTLNTSPANSPRSSGTQNSGKKLYPSIQNIHTLFGYYAYTQDIDALRAMFESHVRLFGILPTTRTYNEMIKFAFLSRRDGDAIDLFKELVQIGQNLDKVQEASRTLPTSPKMIPAEASRSKTPCFGPDFNTFQIMVNSELMGTRSRWGRAWRWIQIMQDNYGLLPSDKMYARTLKAMRRRGADDSTVQALEANWLSVQNLRDGNSQREPNEQLQK